MPENSLAAFEAAANAGYPIELDTRIPRTGPPVVFHDQTLDRLTGANGTISNADYSELAGLRLYSTDQNIPSLPEVLDLVDGKVPILIELKTEDDTARLEAEVCNALHRYSGDFAVQSFESSSVEWFKINAPHFARGLVGETMADLSRNKMDACDPNFLACEHTGLPESKQEKTLLAWTVRSYAEAITAKKVAENIIFEDYFPEIA